MVETLSKLQRKIFLEKIAKKSNTSGLAGKHNRKSLEKLKNNTTTKFKELHKDLEKEKAELKRLTESVESKEAELKASRKDIMDCHDLLRNMDFAGATDVKIGKDTDDISYACDGKWVRFDLDSGEKIPYSKWKKMKNPNIEIIEESDEVEPEEINEVDDPDGIDITV